MQKDDKAQAQTGVRTVRSGCQTGDAGNLPGFEDQAAKDKQESLQDCIAVPKPTISPKKLRAFVTSRAFVIQTSTQSPYFQQLKIGTVTAIIEHV